MFYHWRIMTTNSCLREGWSGGVDTKWGRRIKALSKNAKPTEKSARLKRKHFPSVRSWGSSLVPRREPEAKYTSVNLKAGKEWLKEDLASPHWHHLPNTLNTSETFLLHSWTFQDSRCPTSNLRSQPMVSTGSSPRDHTPILWAFAHAVPLTWNAPPPALPLTQAPFLRAIQQGAPAILPLVCVSAGRKSPEDRDEGLSPTSLWSFRQYLTQSSHWEHVLNEYF